VDRIHRNPFPNREGRWDLSPPKRLASEGPDQGDSVQVAFRWCRQDGSFRRSKTPFPPRGAGRRKAPGKNENTPLSDGNGTSSSNTPRLFRGYVSLTRGLIVPMLALLSNYPLREFSHKLGQGKESSLFLTEKSFRPEPIGKKKSIRGLLAWGGKPVRFLAPSGGSLPPPMTQLLIRSKDSFSLKTGYFFCQPKFLKNRFPFLASAANLPAALSPSRIAAAGAERPIPDCLLPISWGNNPFQAPPGKETATRTE